MKPVFHLRAEGRDFTHRIRHRLLSLSVTDEAGWRSDSVELRLDDRNSQIALPRKGAKLDVSLGYLLPIGEERLVRMGRYVVDAIELTGPPDTLSVRGCAADLRESLKEQKTRAWHNTTIGQLVAQVAAEHQLDPKVAQSLKPISVQHMDQTDESDLHLLTRFAKQHGAIAKASGPFLLFVPRGEATSATGRNLTPVTIHRSQTTRWRMTLPDRPKYQTVRAYWWDAQIAMRTPVLAGQGTGPVFTLRGQYPDPETAYHAANAKLDDLQRSQATLNLTLPGDPQVAAESRLTLSGFRHPINGHWITARVRHEISPSGFTSHIDAEPPKQ